MGREICESGVQGTGLDEGINIGAFGTQMVIKTLSLDELTEGMCVDRGRAND